MGAGALGAVQFNGFLFDRCKPECVDTVFSLQCKAQLLQNTRMSAGRDSTSCDKHSRSSHSSWSSGTSHAQVPQISSTKGRTSTVLRSCSSSSTRSRPRRSTMRIEVSLKVEKRVMMGAKSLRLPPLQASTPGLKWISDKIRDPKTPPECKIHRVSFRFCLEDGSRQSRLRINIPVFGGSELRVHQSTFRFIIIQPKRTLGPASGSDLRGPRCC